MDAFDPAEVPILVVSCDKYQDLWSVFFHLFFKYWPQCPFPIHLVSNTLVYDDPRVRSILVGPDEGYSANLIKALHQTKAKWIIFWVDDRPPCRPVKTDELLDLLHLARERHAAYLQLLDFHPYALVPARERIGEIPSSARYRVSLTIALWRRETFLKILVPGETAWEIEKGGGCGRAAVLKERFFSMSIERRGHAPIRDVHLVTKGRIMLEGIRCLRSERLDTAIGDRRRVSLRYHIYVRLNHMCWDFYYGVKWLLLKALNHPGSASSL